MQAQMMQHIEKDDFEYRPVENKLVCDLLYAPPSQAADKKLIAKEVQKAKDEFVKLKRLGKLEFSA